MSPAVHRFRITTDLAAAPDAVWRHVTAMDGVNDEMRPLLRMTVPPGWKSARIDDLPLGRPAGRSWLLLLGIIPVDFDDLTIAERGPGHRFRDVPGAPMNLPRPGALRWKGLVRNCSTALQ